MNKIWLLLIAFYFLNLGYSDSLRCWVCGGNNTPHSTNPNQPKITGERKGSKHRKNKDDTSDTSESPTNEEPESEPSNRRSKRGTNSGAEEGKERTERKKPHEMAPPSFCTNSVVNMTCKQQYPGQKLLCYKEKWTVDGTTMVKRGCAVEDKRYNLTGCEEQISGPGSFDVLLCLCNEPLCNHSAFNFEVKTPLYILLYAALKLIMF